MKVLDSAKIAKVCHEAKRAYCETIGDHTQTPWDYAPIWQSVSAMKGVEFHLQALSSGSDPAPSASHNSWLEEKRAAGWKYGPVKDADKKEHPCFLPYEQLPVEQRLKDYIFAAICRAYYEAEKTESVTA